MGREAFGVIFLSEWRLLHQPVKMLYYLPVNGIARRRYLLYKAKCTDCRENDVNTRGGHHYFVSI